MISLFKTLSWKFRRTQQPQTYLPLILVTGCSSGIGLALAKELYQCTNYRVVVTAKETSVAILKSLFIESDRFLIRALDVTNTDEKLCLFREIQNRFSGVDILINNAGICYRAALEDMTELDERRQMATNYLAPMELIRMALPSMRSKGRGKIINVSSVSGMLAMPTMASYSASKHALEGATEALWYETRPFGISVSLVQPGFVKSRSFERVKFTRASAHSVDENGDYSDFYSNMAPFIERLMNLSISTPETIAQIVLKVIRKENPPLWVPATFDAHIFALIRKVLPQSLLLPLLFWGLPNSKRWANKITNSRKLKRTSQTGANAPRPRQMTS